MYIEPRLTSRLLTVSSRVVHLRLLAIMRRCAALRRQLSPTNALRSPAASVGRVLVAELPPSGRCENWCEDDLPLKSNESIFC